MKPVNDLKTILVPVNFTANSNNAVRYAADLALVIQGKLHLLHALQMPVSTAEFPVNGFVFDEMQKSAEAGLEQLRTEMLQRTAGKVEIFTSLEIGGVEYCIEDVCTRKIPFMVVMGSSEKSWETALAGSNTGKAIHHLPYPLIIVPENAVFHPIKKILLACELNDIAAGVPVSGLFLQGLQDLFKCSFEVVNIDTGKQEGQTEAERTFEFNSWQQRLHEIYPEVHFVTTKKVEEGINSYLSGHPADLLLVFPKKHGFFEFHKSQAKNIAAHSPVPVMSIRASGAKNDLLFS